MTDFLWPLCRITLLTTFLWMSLACVLLAKPTESVRVILPAQNTCATYVHQYEHQHGIPRGLLHAISKAESGLKDINGRLVAWPWTINYKGQGYYFPTKEAAIEAVQALQAKGASSIDVGCMQVNLYYHPNAFKTLEEAFEPSKNVAYAARFLTGLKKEHNCWHLAMAHYHSANPIHHVPYQKNVLRIWNRDGKAGHELTTAGLFSPQTPNPTNSHIRRLSTGKTLRMASATLMPASRKTSVSRRVATKSSHVRRLALSRGR
ncbi:MAG: hypothetical protein H0X26_02685 [Alphaproteobacteria bacterium]|nr:hypothetical protein [Alphaproteobacteria bacterium]